MTKREGVKPNAAAEVLRLALAQFPKYDPERSSGQYVFRRSYRTAVYAFAPVTLNPGDEKTTELELKDWFRARKLLMSGRMGVIRGAFTIKRSRRGQLDRDFVCGYSTVRRWSNGKIVKWLSQRTFIEYNDDMNHFVGDYVPASVEYKAVDPLEYIMLTQLWCGKGRDMADERALPTDSGITGSVFGVTSGAFNHLLVPAAKVSMKMQLKNIGDVQVQVYATVLGDQQGDT